MPLDSVQLREHVDNFISDLDRREQIGKSPDTSPRALRTFMVGVSKSLERENQHMEPDDYDQFSEALAKDPRFQRHLPFIAMDLMVEGSRIRDGYSRHTDSELQSKSGMTAAADNKDKYDAVHRAALRYASDNFDKFRNYDTTDDFFRIGNAWDITRSDLEKGMRSFQDYTLADVRIAANQKMLDDFSKIDANGNGSITTKETAPWMATFPGMRECIRMSDYSPFHPYGAAVKETAYLCAFQSELTNAAPQQTHRIMPSSENLTREQLSTRIDELRAKKTQFEQHWGIANK
jgi:hypothetical protein